MTAAVSDEHDLIGKGVENRYHRVDVVTKTDVRAVGFRRLEPGERECVHGVAGVSQWCGNLVPRCTVEPEARIRTICMLQENPRPPGEKRHSHRAQDGVRTKP
jgi:hypothetical protein